ncbi:hypothetical protein BJX99DRAFT_264733 [Aspergillus californicus]
MNLLQAWSLVTFAAGLLPISVLASVCEAPKLTHRNWNITSQAQLDELSECTTLDGKLLIWPSYKGPFVLRNVQNITGTISAYSSERGLQPKVTSIELPDLLYIDWSHTDMPTLTRFSAPKLMYAEWIEINGPTAGSTVDLSSLRSVEETLQLQGDFSSLHIPMLWNMPSFMGLTFWEPIDFKLVAESLFEIELEGDVRSVDLPNLKAYKSIKVKSPGFFDCDSFEKKLSWQAKSNDSEIECSSLFKPKPMGTKPEDKAVYTLIGLALVALIVFLVRQKRKPCRCSKEVPCESEVGLLSTAPGDQNDTPLPPYSANPPTGQ